MPITPNFQSEGVVLLRFGQEDELLRLVTEGEMHWSSPLSHKEPVRQYDPSTWQYFTASHGNTVINMGKNLEPDPNDSRIFCLAGLRGSERDLWMQDTTSHIIKNLLDAMQHPRSRPYFVLIRNTQRFLREIDRLCAHLPLMQLYGVFNKSFTSPWIDAHVNRRFAYGFVAYRQMPVALFDKDLHLQDELEFRVTISPAPIFSWQNATQSWFHSYLYSRSKGLFSGPFPVECLRDASWRRAHLASVQYQYSPPTSHKFSWPPDPVVSDFYMGDFSKFDPAWREADC